MVGWLVRLSFIAIPCRVDNMASIQLVHAVFCLHDTFHVLEVRPQCVALNGESPVMFVLVDVDR